MIKVFKIVKQKYDRTVAPRITFNPSSVTRGNNYRLFKQRCHRDLRKFSFTNKIVNIWNSLPIHVTLWVEVDTVDEFKSRLGLDKFWMYRGPRH